VAVTPVSGGVTFDTFTVTEVNASLGVYALAIGRLEGEGVIRIDILPNYLDIAGNRGGGGSLLVERDLTPARVTIVSVAGPAVDGTTFDVTIRFRSN
jgi:hypothetical protein